MGNGEWANEKNAHHYYQLPITNSQLPIPNYQFPITNSQCPMPIIFD
ncbi:alpha/beta hydrolase [Tolypothrix sp. VBCCA 56010]